MNIRLRRSKNRTKKQSVLRIDSDLLKELELLSKSTGRPINEVLATCVFLGKNALGREVEIKDLDEKVNLSIKALQAYPKVTSLT